MFASKRKDDRPSHAVACHVGMSLQLIRHEGLSQNVSVATVDSEPFVQRTLEPSTEAINRRRPG